jgi:UDP-N-acetylmuramate dehydrogenase
MGGVARYFCCPASVDDMGLILRRCAENNIPVKFLGGGSNLLITSEKVDAMVIWIHAPFMTSIEFDGERVSVGAGVSVRRLVAESVRRGLTGLEFMVGVHGTAGGAVGSDASTRSGRFLDLVQRVDTVGPQGTLEVKSKEDISEVSCAVTGCALELKTDDPGMIRERINIETTYRRESQPQGVSSAGCAFRNPPGDSAGRLIEEAELKGLRIGGAKVSETHANFIVNMDSASGGDVLNLINRIREAVLAKFGITLELEVDIW